MTCGSTTASPTITPTVTETTPYSPTNTPTITYTPTTTPLYEIKNTITLGQYGIAATASAQCLVLLLLFMGGALWIYMQKRNT